MTTTEILNILTKKYILAALRHIDCNGVEKNRQSTRYDLIYRQKAYPPKYVISIAVGKTGRKDLAPGEFSGGAQSNGILQKLGFEIRPKRKKQTAASHTSPKELR
jgi:hypothetical protein